MVNVHRSRLLASVPSYDVNGKGVYGIIEKTKRERVVVWCQNSIKKEPLGHVLYRVLMIAIGASLAAFAIERLLVPNKMIDGGIIGISLILDYLTPDEWRLLNFATLVILLNAPFMYFGYKQIGKTFMLSTILAS
ncbi:putative membrane spanning protein [Geobacillus sp. WSUCF1]|nr:putative membrane spanning protein [Geobacillus sp. WSUCF1]